jgi:hypothetical protein
MATFDVATLIADTTEFTWDVTRTRIDIAMKNYYQKVKLEYAAKFNLNGKCIDPPSKTVGFNAATSIHLEADITKSQFEGTLLYKLVPDEPVTEASSDIYLALCWKVTASSGLYIHVALIEHSESSMPLKKSTIAELCHQIFHDKLQKLDEAIICSWYINEDRPFTVSMIAGGSRFSKIRVGRKEKSNVFNPITPSGRDRVVIKVSNIVFRCVKGHLLCEIVKHNDHQMPLIWGALIFLAIALSISIHQVDKRKIAASIYLFRPDKFQGDQEDFKELCEDSLRRRMAPYSQDSARNLGGWGLQLEIYFGPKAQANLFVRLSRVNILSDDMPIPKVLSSDDIG